jgi:DNA/RNA endonuclease YhcR with UshA esterase domain
MTRFTAWRCILVLAAAGVVATFGRQEVRYTAVEASRHIGEKAIVTGRVDSLHQSVEGNISLNIEGKYPDQIFIAFIPAAAAAEFSDVGQYGNKTVAVSGKIELYRGTPQIVLSLPSQITLK